MYYYRLMSAVFMMVILLALGVSFVGCDNKPPETAHRVIMDDDDGVDTPTETEQVLTDVVVAPDTDIEPAESGTETDETTPEAIAGEAKVYSIEPNPESYISFKGYQALKAQEGFFNVFEGEITIEADDFTTAQVELSIDMDSLSTRTRMLTNVLKDEDFFFITEYPSSTFVSSRFEKADGEDEYIMHGALTMRGVERRLGIPVKMHLDDAGLHMSSELVIDRYNWGIEKDGYLDEAINKEVFIEFGILAEPKS